MEEAADVFMAAERAVKRCQEKTRGVATPKNKRRSGTIKRESDCHASMMEI